MHAPYIPNATFGELIAFYLMRLLSVVVRVLFYCLNILHYRNSQKAEYLADYLGSRVSGTAAFIAMNDRIGVMYNNNHKVQNCINRNLQTPEEIIPEIVAEFEQVPDIEYERVKKLGERELHSLDAAHPPTHYRNELLHRFPAEAMHEFTDEENRAMNIEISVHISKLGQS